MMTRWMMFFKMFFFFCDDGRAVQLRDQRPSHSYLIGVFDLWRFQQRTNGNRLGARVWIFENGYGTHLLIC